MGLLSVLYFDKSMADSKYKIDALVWAEIAAAYDPIQKGTTTRHLLRAYMSEDELKKVETILKRGRRNLISLTSGSFPLIQWWETILKTIQKNQKFPRTP